VSEPNPKPTPRIRNRNATKIKLLSDSLCRACRATATNCHHLIPKGSQRGDDVPQNLIPLCGSGSEGCHGALHGNPYVAKHVHSEWEVTERRDSEWVRRQIGQRLRPEELMYVGAKMGAEAGAEYLRRRYFVDAASPVLWQ